MLNYVDGKSKAIFVLVCALCLSAVLGVWAYAASFPQVITDGMGRQVELQRAPQRLITLAPSLTENVFALGGGDLVVGVSSYSDYPAEAKTKPIIGDAFGPNFEQIILLAPDLIIGDAQLVQNHMTKLEELGLPVLALDSANLAGVMRDLRVLGQAIGREPEAEQLVADMLAKITWVTDAVQDVAEADRPLVFVEVWDEPLMTCGPGSFIHELIELAGGKNLAADARDAWVEYSSEQVIIRDPEVIILTRPYANELMNRPAWRHIRAVVQNRVIEVNEDAFVRTTPRLANDLVDLFRILHPGPVE